MQDEHIIVSSFVEIIIRHHINLVELTYFRAAKMHEISLAMEVLKQRPDWDIVQYYQFKSKY